MTDDEMKYRLTRLRDEIESITYPMSPGPHLLRAHEIVRALIREVELREGERLMAVRAKTANTQEQP